ncbi:pentatricopeptide repeat-containing protein [Salix suchowensis]|nr:pentatricopeptide repeat-containing protein [Salix suchowensis]
MAAAAALISRAGNPKVSIIPVIEQWLEEGNSIKKPDLQNFIKLFRRHRRFSHALQGHELSPGDFAVQLDLISKVHGLEQAEEYYNSIPDHLKGIQVYGALLNCYAHKRHMEKQRPRCKR